MMVRKEVTEFNMISICHTIFAQIDNSLETESHTLAVKPAYLTSSSMIGVVEDALLEYCEEQASSEN